MTRLAVVSYSMTFLVVLLVLIAVATASSPCINPTPTSSSPNPTTLLLDFHHAKEQAQVIDLSAQTADDRAQQQLYLVKTSPHNLSDWGLSLRPILVDYIPDNFWLVYTSGEVINGVIIELEGKLGHKDVDGVAILPPTVRLSPPAQEYLAMREADLSLGNLQLQFEQQQLEMSKTSDQLGGETDSAPRKLRNSNTERQFVHHTTPKVHHKITSFHNSTEDEVIATSQPQQQYPQRTLKADELFRNVFNTVNNHRPASPTTPSSITTTTTTSHCTLQSIPISQSDSQLMMPVVNQVPLFLQQHEDLYHLVESDIDNGFIFNDPKSFRLELEVDTYTTDQTMSQIGTLTTSAAKSFMLTFTALDNERDGLTSDQYVYNDMFTAHSKKLLNKLEESTQTLQSKFKSSLSSPVNTDELSFRGLAGTFKANDINLDVFGEQFDRTYSRLAQSPRASPQSTHLLPLHISLQHRTRPTNTISTSNVAMNNVRLQFQSPLLITNTTFIAETLQTRLTSFHQLILDLAKSNTTFDLVVDQLIDLLAEQYFSNVFAHHNREYTYPTQQDQEIAAACYDNYQPSYNVRAHLVQYIDAIIISLFQTQFQRQQQQQHKTFQTSQLLSVKSMGEILTTLLQFQLNTITTHISNSIQTILAQPNLYMVELDQKLALSNNYARFALTVGLDNIPVDYDVPVGMSYTGPYNDAGVNGSGVIISVADSGSDYGSCYLMDSDTTHAVPFTKSYTTPTTSTHRKYQSYLTLGDKLDYLNGHGSHVSGSVVASCVTAGAQSKAVQNGALPNGLLSFVDFAIGTSLVSFEPTTVFQHAIVNGAIITSNSWGNAATKVNHVAQNNLYSAKESRLIDQFLNANQGLAALFASSNDGLVAFGTINQQVTSKNTIAIGSAQASRSQGVHAKESNGSLPAFLNTPTSFSNLHNLYGGTSSMGPTFDGRIKPDFVAPGATVTSVAATAKSTYSCGWTIKSGTSMATPTTAGLWGMMEQILREGRINSGTPRSSRAYDKSTITGSFLRALAMQSAQRIDYRSNYIDAPPQPMKTQTQQLQPVNWGGSTFTHYPMGEVHQNGFSTGLIVNLYVQPTRDSQFVTSSKRLIRFVPYFGCKNAAFTVTAQVGSDSGPSGQTYKKSFVFESVDSTERSTLDIPMSSSQSLFFTFEFTAAPCSASGNQLTMIFQEFIGDSYATSQRYQDATCADRFDALPSFIQPNFLSAHRHYIRCPPTPACTDQFDNTPLYGNRHFSTNSSICRSALHTGAVNMTLYELTDQTEAQKHILYGKRQTVMVAESTTATLRKEPANWHYGVTSQFLDTSAIDPATKDYVDVDVFGFEVVGEPLDGAHSGNDLMYLRRLPPAENFASGYGIPKLSTIFPLTQHIFYQQSGQSSSNTVQRFSAILKSAAPDHAIGNAQAQSHCVFVSSKPLANVYRVTGETQIWTSGEDSFRASLAWYDVPGSATSSSRVLVNDLDLFVFGPDGTEYRGNHRADRLNNGERVDLLQGTFTPGMYCAVVHGVNVPVGPQRYSLITHGRGLSYCLDNPFPFALSGVFRREGNAQCENVHSSSIGAQFEPHQLQFLEDDPEASAFHKEVGAVQVRSGGDCFAIHDITFPSAVNKVNVFKQQRLSPSRYEDQKDWDMDSFNGHGSMPSKTRFAISGRLDGSSKSDLTFSGELYNHLFNPTYDPNQPIEDQIVEIPSGTGQSINDVMMENNIRFLVSGTVDPNNKSFYLTLKGKTRQCRYSFYRTQQYEDVQF